MPLDFLKQIATFLLSDEINEIFDMVPMMRVAHRIFFAVIDHRDDDWHSDYLREAQASEKKPTWLLGFL